MVTAKMIYLGFRFYNEIDSNNEEWKNPKTGKTFRIRKSDNYISQEDLINILEQADVSMENFQEV